MSNDQFDVVWRDGGREPQVAPNPKFPDGRHVDIAGPTAKASCTMQLPYPAKRCGIYMVRCLKCDYTAVITTAGRADDPRSVRMPCKGVVAQ